jgi:hypothetical protein
MLSLSFAFASKWLAQETEGGNCRIYAPSKKAEGLANSTNDAVIFSRPL